MAIAEFFKQEADYADWLRRGGYVCNGLGLGDNREWHRVHRSNCNSLNSNYGRLRTSVRKVCGDDLSELVATVTSRFGPEGEGFQFCAFCRPQDDLK